MSVVWAWMKKYWEFIVGGLLVAFGVILGIQLEGKKAPVLAPPNPVKDAADKEATAEDLAAEQKAADAKTEISKEHDQDVAKVVQQVTDKTQDVRADTGKTNEYVLDVGKQIRGGD